MTQSTTKRLRIEIDQVLALMIAVATGGPEIKSKQAEYAKRRQAIQQLVYEAGLEDPNPYDDLWQWYGKWSNDLPKYQDRRTYVRNLYKPLLEAIDKLEEYSVSAALKEVEHLSEIDNVPELRLHAARIRYSVEQDPAQAIGSAKELLETTLKTILSDHGAKHTEDIPTLI